MQLSRSIFFNQVSEFEKCTVGGWKLIYAFRKNLDFKNKMHSKQMEKFVRKMISLQS
jgi:hypothetical protein